MVDQLTTIALGTRLKSSKCEDVTQAVQHAVLKLVNFVVVDNFKLASRQLLFLKFKDVV